MIAPASQPRLEVAEILRAHGEAYRAHHPVSPEQATVLRRLIACRTAALGGHVDSCDACGTVRISYNSCRDRHCPKCQTTRQLEWVESRLARLLPVPYFHVVFTLPAEVADIAKRAREKKLMPDDVQGGTFTITNPGGYGTFHGTPVISQPQSGILGTYALVKRPWVIQDALGKDVIAIRPMMNITLTYDHRLVDGAYAGGFLRDLRARLEGWDDGGTA